MAEKFEFLAVLPEQQLAEVRQRLVRKNYDRGEPVFWAGSPGDALYLVDRGKVRIEGPTPLGRTATFAVLGEGSFFGELALVGESASRSASAIAIESRTSLLKLDRGTFEMLRLKHPAVNELLFRVLDAQSRRLSEHLLETLFFEADLRVARRLLTLCEAYGIEADRSQIGLTQEAIADLSGVTRPTLSRIIKQQAPEGLFITSRGGIGVTSVVELEDWCDRLLAEAEERETQRVFGTQ